MSPADAYFEWLISQINSPSTHTYQDLFGRMHMTDFLWVIEFDDNRVQDGLDLRDEFFDGRKFEARTNSRTDIISMLELLVSLSRRVAFTAGGDPGTWAWQLIKNLNLHRFYDPINLEAMTKVDEILYSIIWRGYRYSGKGGFFPLRHPEEDQRKVELWTQMNAYVNEKMTER
jgi:hypothetical protein